MPSFHIKLSFNEFFESNGKTKFMWNKGGKQSLFLANKVKMLVNRLLECFTFTLKASSVEKNYLREHARATSKRENTGTSKSTLYKPGSNNKLDSFLVQLLPHNSVTG